MKKYINGEYVEMTADEISAMQEELKRLCDIEKNNIPSVDERLAAIESAILNILGVM